MDRGYTISVERDGAIIRIHATQGEETYSAQFTPSADAWDSKPRDHAIDALIEMICGFSKSHILIALFNLDQGNGSNHHGSGSIEHRRRDIRP